MDGFGQADAARGYDGSRAAGLAIRQENETQTARPLNARLAVIVDRQMQQHARMANVLEAIALSLGCAEPVPMNAARDGGAPRPPEPVPTASIHVMRLEQMLEQYAEANCNLALKIARYLDGAQGTKG